MNVCWRVAAVVVLVCAISGTAHAQWVDEFNGSGAVSSGTWTYDVGGGGWGNNELEYYQSGNANVNQANGYVTIQARQQSVGGMAYTSGRIKTQGIKTFQQGYKVEARARGPMGQGLWPAIWALGSNITSVPWPGCGEIDILEHVNSIPNNVGTIHWDFGGHASYTAAQPAVTFTNWNNYGIEWTSSLIRWTLNGAYVGDANIAGGINGTDEFGAGKPFFVIMNLAVGGDWPGPPNGTAVFPANLDVDWIRVTNMSGPTATATSTTGPTATATRTPTATATNSGGTATATATNSGGTSTSVNLSSFYNVNAHYSNGTTFASNGGIDGVGSAYSSTLLGSNLSWSGTTFNFGPANQLNGVRNRTVTLPAGQFSTLLLLGTGVNGDQTSQTVRVNYTDGTNSTFTQTFSNWLNASQNVAGQSIAFGNPYRNKSTGLADNRVFNLYGYSFALTSSKTVSSLVLPATNNVTVLSAVLRSSGGATATSTPTRAATATATATTGGGTGNCAGVAAFVSCTAYANGAQVVYNNTLYHAIAAIPATRDCPPTSPFNPSNDNWWVNDGACSGGATATATATTSGATPTRTNTPTATATTGGTPVPTPAPGCVGCTHKRLKVINGCGQPIWMQYLNGNGGGSLTAPNRFRLGSLGASIEYDIPDIGIAGVRFWPGMGCDANGHNCTIGASGGPASMGFTCPAHGCGPPVDSKFEATFGCMTGTGCQGNPSGGGAPLGNLDWWNTSAVDGYTLPFQVRAIGNCPVGPQPTGPGGPPGGITSCANIRFADCPTNENLSSNGQFPDLSSVNLRLNNPATGAIAGCFSPSAKMTSSQWNAGFATYPPQDPHAQWYACPTPPITPAQCSAGPANSTAYRNVIHNKCTNTYAYAYDDTFGLATCPAAANMTYEVTFYCPQ